VKSYLADVPPVNFMFFHTIGNGISIKIHRSVFFCAGNMASTTYQLIHKVAKKENKMILICVSYNVQIA
jgi:hypothetical protein